MTRRQQDPLRTLQLEEHRMLEQIGRSGSERADRVARAKALLAVAGGASYTEAAMKAGRRSGDAVAHLVARFNQEGLAALSIKLLLSLAADAGAGPPPYRPNTGVSCRVGQIGWSGPTARPVADREAGVDK
jgi:hypothetical protein